MFRRALFPALAAASIAAFVISPPAVAQWSDDPAAPTPVCTAEYGQWAPRLVAVEDGFVVTWQDRRREDTHVDIYAQKISPDGDMLWPENGRVVAAGPDGALAYGVQVSAGLLPDGAGGALVAWNDYPSLYYIQAFATRVATDATVAWGDPGEEIQYPDTAVPLMMNDALGTNHLPEAWDIAADTEGGFFAPVNAGIGRYDALGALRTDWYVDTAADVGLTKLMVPVLENGGKDGVIVAWTQSDVNFSDGIRARKLVDPETAWPAEPDTLGDAWGLVSVIDPAQLGLATMQICRIATVPDGAGGAIIAWIDNRIRSDTEAFYRVFAQRIDTDGNLLWSTDGIEVSGDLFTYGCYWWSRLYLAADGAGGAVIAWNDGDSRQWVQRLGADGDALWGDAGVIVATGIKTTHGLVRANDGDYIVLYHDAVKAEILAQKLDADNGAPLWEGGRLVYDGCFSPYYHEARMVSDGQAGAVSAWEACDGNIYAHRLVESGFEDYLVAELLGIAEGEETTVVTLELGAPESGLLNVTVTAVDGQANVPAFTPGTTDPVEVALEADNDAVATFHVQAETTGGVHDVHLAVVRNLGRTDRVELLDEQVLAVESTTFGGVTAAETRAEVFNLEPGLKRLNIDVNDETFEALKRLEDNQVVELDLAPVLAAGENTVTLTSYGKEGLGSVVLIAPAR